MREIDFIITIKYGVNMAPSSVGLVGDLQGFSMIEDETTEAESRINEIGIQIARIQAKDPAGPSLLTTFPFKNTAGQFQGNEADFSIENGLLTLAANEGETERCIQSVVTSNKRLIMIPLVLTTKPVGKENESGWFEHLKNHIVGVVVDKTNKTIEYYDSQGKVLADETRRLLLTSEVYPQEFLVQLQSALVAAEPEVNQPQGVEDFIFISSKPEWPIISNSVRHQGFFDQKTCGYRVTRFFQERIVLNDQEARPGSLFSSESLLSGRGYEHRAYIEEKYHEEITRLKPQE